ncbi:MAG: hypothetical protein IK032_02535 [Bacteroidales bacterium]|nr:hypothetical protein [Bacteroidales bacterium]
MNLQDFSEYDTVALARLIASKKNWLETVPSGDPRRNRMISEINLLENVYLKLEAHTNWVLRPMDAAFNRAFIAAMQLPMAKEGRLGGFLFYWQISDYFTRYRNENLASVATFSNVPVTFPDMMLNYPQGCVVKPVSIIEITPDDLSHNNIGGLQA